MKKNEIRRIGIASSEALSGISWRRADYRKSIVETSELAVPYDELDYRLMATFPASDATARY